MSTSTLTDRVFNFSAGPAVMPLPVLEQAQRDLLSLPGVGSSVLEISHRSAVFIEILESAKSGLRSLLNIPDNYHIAFIQGGSRLQFSMVPMNLLGGQDGPGDYIVAGSWGQKAVAEAKRNHKTNVVWDGKENNFDRLPEAGDLKISPDAAFVHMTSNETIHGIQFQDEPDVGDAVLVSDASSDFMYRPLPIDRYGLIYACAQKNAGPAGVTVLIIRDDLLERSQDSLPGYLNYSEHIKNNSLWNTPPTFGIYLVDLVCKWLQDEIGGLEKMHERNKSKAATLYAAIDESDGFYQGHAQPDSRSLMNVTFRLPDDETEKAFLSSAEEKGLCSLKGHRSVGGIRASIYNAMPVEGVEALAEFMRDFKSSR